jgi:hypothetical protein
MKNKIVSVYETKCGHVLLCNFYACFDADYPINKHHYPTYVASFLSLKLVKYKFYKIILKTIKSYKLFSIKLTEDSISDIVR